MADVSKLIATLRTRIQLKAPNDESDVVYQITDSALQEIVEDATVVHNKDYTVSSLPRAEEPFVLWLAEIEVFRALASGNSRFFKIEAKGAQLNKQQRVDHYLKLIEGLERKYDIMWARFKEMNPSQIDVGEVYTSGPHYLGRAYRLRQAPSISLSGIAYSDHVDLTWDTEDKRHARFTIYKLASDSEVIIDEFEIPDDASWSVPLNANAESVWSTFDNHRTKYRVKGLTPNTAYKLAVVIETEIGLWGYNEISVTTTP